MIGGMWRNKAQHMYKDLDIATHTHINRQIHICILTQTNSSASSMTYETRGKKTMMMVFSAVTTCIVKYGGMEAAKNGCGQDYVPMHICIYHMYVFVCFP